SSTGSSLGATSSCGTRRPILRTSFPSHSGSSSPTRNDPFIAGVTSRQRGGSMKRETLVSLLVVALGTFSMAATQLRGYVVANGGVSSPPSAGGAFKAYTTAGQAVIGVSDNPFNELRHGFWSFGGSRVVAVDSKLPTKLSVGLPYPNPTRDD